MVKWMQSNLQRITLIGKIIVERKVKIAESNNELRGIYTESALTERTAKNWISKVICWNCLW